VQCHAKRARKFAVPGNTYLVVHEGQHVAIPVQNSGAQEGFQGGQQGGEGFPQQVSRVLGAERAAPDGSYRQELALTILKRLGFRTRILVATIAGPQSG
jgi:hypothetical protein